MRCKYCKWWGEGDGGGHHFDAGRVNYCNNLRIKCMQHPAWEATKLYVESNKGNDQVILTRWDFGCILFETNGKTE